MARKFYWQPELSIAIIYWSTTFTFFFLGFILTLEKSTVYWKSLLAFFFFFLLLLLSRKRYLRFSETSITLSSVMQWCPISIPYEEIEQIQWQKNNLLFEYYGKKFEGYFFSKNQKAFSHLLQQKFPEKLTEV